MIYRRQLLPLFVFSLLFSLCTALSFHADAYAKKKAPSIAGVTSSAYTDTEYTLSLKRASGKVTWSVSSRKLASVKKKSSKKAILTLKKKGTVAVKAKYKGKTYKKKVKIKGTRLKSSSSLYYPGRSYTLKLSNASSGITWSVTNTKGSVKKGSSGKATFTALKPGSVTVKAKFKGLIYKKKITVSKPVLSSDSLVFSNTSTQNLAITGPVSTAENIVTNWSSISSKAASATKIYWAIEDPLVVSIDQVSSGKIRITPRSKGSTTIGVRYYGTTYSCKIIVNTDFKEETDTFDESKLILPDLDLPEDIPAYWEHELALSVAAVKERSKQGGDMASFIFLTDPHWKLNAGHSPALINYLSGLLNPAYTVCGGDIVTGIYTTDADGFSAKENAINEINAFYSLFDSDVRLISTVGNHDTNSNNRQNDSNGLRLSKNELYENMIFRSGSHAHIYQDDLLSYADDTEHKVRYICFFWDGIHYEDITQADYDWIDQTVMELGSDWTVVFCTHAYWKSAVDVNVISDVAPSQTALKLGRHIANLDAVSNAEIALWMVGHCHRDLDTRIASDDGNATIQIVSTNCDSYQKSNRTDSGGQIMQAETDTEQAFDYVQIDTQKRWVYLTRVGAGKSRSFSY